MSYGLLDLPSPLFGGVDAAMATLLPPVVRLVVWALIGAVVSMLLYYLLTPQTRIGEAKKEAANARRRLNAFDGEFADAGPLIGDQFKTSFRHIGLVLPGTVLASLPVLCMLVWLETAYGHTFPPAGQTPEMVTQPESAQARWVVPGEPGAAPQIQVRDTSGAVVAEFEMDAPVPVIHKRQWWNWLIGNPIGYLPDNSPVNHVRIDLPSGSYLPFGPGWLRSWVTVFLSVLVVTSLLIHRFSRIN